MAASWGLIRALRRQCVAQRAALSGPRALLPGGSAGAAACVSMRHVSVATKPIVVPEVPSYVGKRPRLLILGSGWAAMNLIKGLDGDALKRYNIMVCSPTNHFVNTPLLPSVTVGTMGPRTVAEPIRHHIVNHRKKHPDAWIKFNEVGATKVDAENKRVLVKTHLHDRGAMGIEDLASATRDTEYWLDYDVLVCAVGATTNTFNTPGAAEYCSFLKTVKDAMGIRSTLLDCFETAAVKGLPDKEIDRLLKFVIIGAGPTGVEIAAEIRDFVKEDILPNYSGFADREIKVQIVEMSPRMLGTYDKLIQEYTRERFHKSDIEMLTEHQVKKVNPTSVEALDLKTGETRVLDFGLCVWASGVRPNDVSLDLAKEFQGSRMLETDGNLRVRGLEGSVFALGDCAKITMPAMKAAARSLFEKADVNKDGSLSLAEFQAMIEQSRREYPHLEAYLGYASKDSIEAMYKRADADGKFGISLDEFEVALAEVDKELKSLPPTAQVASQQGQYLAKVLNRLPYEDLAHQGGFEPAFEYNHSGSMAYIGGEHAVIDSPVFGVSTGVSTYVLWKGVYWSNSVSLTMKLDMLFDWAKAWFLGRDTSRF